MKSLVLYMKTDRGDLFYYLFYYFAYMLGISLIKSDIVETEKHLTEIKGFLTVGVERFELPTSSL